MSSHREAPEIAKDPVADSTDLYAFVSPDQPDTVTLIANYVPLQEPAGGPNFYEFGDDVLLEIHIDNNGDGQRRHHLPVPVRDQTAATRTRSCTTPARSRRWTARTGTAGSSTPSPASTPRAARRTLGRRPGLPAVQHRPAVHPQLPGAGQRRRARPRRRRQGVRRAARRGLLRRPRLDLRPGQPAAVPAAAQPVRAARLHRAQRPASTRPSTSTCTASPSRCPITDLVRSGGSGEADPRAVIGVWTTASRQRVRLWDADSGENLTPARSARSPGWATRCSTRSSSRWATRTTGTRCRRPTTSSSPLLRPPRAGHLLPVLYPGVFPNLAALDKSGKARADLVAILLTGIPAGVVPGFQN